MQKKDSIVKKIFWSFFYYQIIPALVGVSIITAIVLLYINDVQKRIHFERLENLKRRIHKEKQTLSGFLLDWVDYESTVKYFNKQYPELVEDEFRISIKNLNYHFFASIDRQGKLMEIYLFDKDGNYRTVPREFRNFFAGGNVPYLTKREDEVAGFLKSDKEILMFVARGVLWFKEEYKISHGTLVFGRILDDKFLKELQDDLGYEVTIREITSDMKFKNDLELEPKDIFTNVGRYFISDVTGKPLFYFEVYFPNDYLKYSLLILAIIVFVFVVVVVISYYLLNRDIRKKIILRIQHLNGAINLVKENPTDLRSFVSINGNDEISELQGNYREMIEKLKKYDEMNKVYIELLEQEKGKTLELLLNILPKPIAYRLFENNEKLIAEGYNEASILFADIVNFTTWSRNLDPHELVYKLNDLFTRFDSILENFNVEKIKTIGDCYMAATGIPHYDENHADNLVRFAFTMIEIIEKLNRETGLNLQMRIGINSGRVVAGVIGTKKFIYDVWGDTVNVASRIESYGIGNQIQISESTYKMLKDKELKSMFRKRGKLQLKSGAVVDIYVNEGILKLTRSS